jgi:hypothetical protein
MLPAAAIITITKKASQKTVKFCEKKNFVRFLLTGLLRKKNWAPVLIKNTLSCTERITEHTFCAEYTCCAHCIYWKIPSSPHL